MSETSLRIVVVGAGQAGGEIATELRRRGHAGPLTLVGEEPRTPYRRPPLSKAFLCGTVDEASLALHGEAALAKAGIDFVGGTRVTAIDRVRREVRLQDGRTLPYDRLALATGGRARPLRIPGAGAANVHLLRSVADVQAIRAEIAPGRRALIVGGGFIGLEVAASLRKLGLEVTVLEGLPRVLARVTAPVVSEWFERLHRAAGVDLRAGVAIEAFEGQPRVTAAVLGDGSRVACDFVVAGIGILPNVELAEAAGLVVDNGIAVDAHCRSSDPHIVAAGDCAAHDNAHYARRLRLESVPNAMEQGRAAAAALLDAHEPYAPVPWFWSDQYDTKLQMTGLSAGHDAVLLRGDPAGDPSCRAFIAFYLQDGHLIAADCVNQGPEFGTLKKLVAARARLDAVVLADAGVPLKTLLPA